MQRPRQKPPTQDFRRRDRWLEWLIGVSSRYLKPLPLGQFWHEFLIFGVKQAWACLFAAVLIVSILLTYWLYPKDAALPRYDMLFLIALGAQVLLLVLKFEQRSEARVIAIYHVVGTIMELYKTAHASWIYPEASFIRIAGVPLFSGFMYSTVGSYIARCWRLFDFRFAGYPDVRWTWVLALLIYANFFTHHYVMDVRYLMIAMTAWLYRRCWVYFTCDTVRRRMPMVLGFFLVSIFIWLAENIGTFSAIWLYPHQAQGGWQMVGFEKLGSWFLLMIISFVLVTTVHKPQKV